MKSKLKISLPFQFQFLWKVIFEARACSFIHIWQFCGSNCLHRRRSCWRLHDNPCIYRSFSREFCFYSEISTENHSNKHLEQIQQIKWTKQNHSGVKRFAFVPIQFRSRCTLCIIRDRTLIICDNCVIVIDILHFFFLLTVRAWACINCVGSTTADHRIESVSVSRSLKSDGNLFASIWRNNYLLCVFQELIFVIVGISIGFVWTKSWRIYRAILTCGALYECNLWTKQQ